MNTDAAKNNTTKHYTVVPKITPLNSTTPSTTKSNSFAKQRNNNPLKTKTQPVRAINEDETDTIHILITKKNPKCLKKTPGNKYQRSLKHIR